MIGLQGVFSEKSDVWSYGVTLWELWELGRDPFQSYQQATELRQELQAGCRLGKPDNCSDQLYSLMLTCWEVSPGARPRFAALHRTMEGMRAQLAEQRFQQRFLPGRAAGRAGQTELAASGEYSRMQTRHYTAAHTGYTIMQATR